MTGRSAGGSAAPGSPQTCLAAAQSFHFPVRDLARTGTGRGPSVRARPDSTACDQAREAQGTGSSLVSLLLPAGPRVAGPSETACHSPGGSS